MGRHNRTASDSPVDAAVADGDRDRSEKREVEGVASWRWTDRPNIHGANRGEVPAVVRVVAVATEKIGHGRHPSPFALGSHLHQGRHRAVVLVQSSPIGSHVPGGSRKSSRCGTARRSEQHERCCGGRGEDVDAKIATFATHRWGVRQDGCILAAPEHPPGRNVDALQIDRCIGGTACWRLLEDDAGREALERSRRRESLPTGERSLPFHLSVRSVHGGQLKLLRVRDGEHHDGAARRDGRAHHV